MPSVTLIDFQESPFELISGSSPQFTKLLAGVRSHERSWLSCWIGHRLTDPPTWTR